MLAEYRDWMQSVVRPARQCEQSTANQNPDRQVRVAGRQAPDQVFGAHGVPVLHPAQAQLGQLHGRKARQGGWFRNPACIAESVVRQYFKPARSACLRSTAPSRSTA